MVLTPLRKEMPHGSEPQLEAKSPQVGPQEVQFWLEWAGERMLSTKVNGTRPSSFRSFWPDYADDPHTAYGYTGISLRFPSPSAPDVSLMDEILDLILLIPNGNIRRIIQLRSLITPIRNRHVFSWERIAEKTHSNQHLVKLRHRRGIEIIIDRAPLSLVHKIQDALV